MVWDRGSEPLVFPTRWDLLGVALGGALVWTCGTGVGFTERSVGRRLRVTYEGFLMYRVIWIVIRTDMCMTKHIIIWTVIRTKLYMTKAYYKMDIAHNRVNQLITHNIHKQTTKLNQLVK